LRARYFASPGIKTAEQGQNGVPAERLMFGDRTDRIAPEGRYFYTGQSISPSTPTVPHELCSRARLPRTPGVADSGRAAPPRGSFHFSEWICISQNFNDRRARAAHSDWPSLAK